MSRSEIPIITIDGPSGTGKGTVAGLLAEKLGWHLLDSGALYRAVAWATLKFDVDPKDESAIVQLLTDIKIDFQPYSPSQAPKICCQDQNITLDIREEIYGNMASVLAAVPQIRSYLLKYQRMMRQAPGLIADGRDMGSVVFPNADVKFYLDASADIRAGRRYKQLIEKGSYITFEEVYQDLLVRDYRDQHREISPMKATSDMIQIDTSDLSVEQVFASLLIKLQERLPIICTRSE